MNPDRTPKKDHIDLLYGSKSPADKNGRELAFSSYLSLTVHAMLVMM